MAIRGDGDPHAIADGQLDEVVAGEDHVEDVLAGGHVLHQALGGRRAVHPHAVHEQVPVAGAGDGEAGAVGRREDEVGRGDAERQDRAVPGLGGHRAVEVDARREVRHGDRHLGAHRWAEGGAGVVHELDGEGVGAGREAGDLDGEHGIEGVVAERTVRGHDDVALAEHVGLTAGGGDGEVGDAEGERGVAGGEERAVVRGVDGEDGVDDGERALGGRVELGVVVLGEAHLERVRALGDAVDGEEARGRLALGLAVHVDVGVAVPGDVGAVEALGVEHEVGDLEFDGELGAVEALAVRGREDADGGRGARVGLGVALPRPVRLAEEAVRAAGGEGQEGEGSKHRNPRVRALI